jgi:hypothetical protein
MVTRSPKVTFKTSLTLTAVQIRKDKQSKKRNRVNGQQLFHIRVNLFIYYHFLFIFSCYVLQNRQNLTSCTKASMRQKLSFTQFPSLQKYGQDHNCKKSYIVFALNNSNSADMGINNQESHLNKGLKKLNSYCTVTSPLSDKQTATPTMNYLR